MKKCPLCKKEKKLGDFNIKNKLKKTPSSYCILCSRIYVNEHYLKNKKYYIDKTGRHREEMRKYIQGQKNKSCIDCNIFYPSYVMDFDHRNRKEKKYEVSIMARRGYSLKNIKKEIQKCDLVCANCHRIRTFKNVEPL